LFLVKLYSEARTGNGFLLEEKLKKTQKRWLEARLGRFSDPLQSGVQESGFSRNYIEIQVYTCVQEWFRTYLAFYGLELLSKVVPGGYFVFVP